MSGFAGDFLVILYCDGEFGLWLVLLAVLVECHEDSFLSVGFAFVILRLRFTCVLSCICRYGAWVMFSLRCTVDT